MFKQLTFKKSYRCFNEGETFEFIPNGLNLLVGEQGSGKSTLIEIIRNSSRYLKEGLIDYRAQPAKMYSFDFERDNLRTKGYFDDKSIEVQVQSHWHSHGETNLLIINAIKDAKDALILMDEPDMALSISSCHTLVRHMLAAVVRGCQIIAAVHNPVVISGAARILSLEHRKWMLFEEFIKSHGGLTASDHLQGLIRPLNSNKGHSPKRARQKKLRVDIL